MESKSRNYIRGITAFKKGRLSQARRFFEKINRGRKNYAPALLEIQKINYREKKWDRFFGMALYYRSELVSSVSLAKKYFFQEMLALEVLALIRHCKFNTAYQLVEQSLAMGKKAGKKTEKIQKAGWFFNLKKWSLENHQKKQKNNFLKRIQFWPLNKQQLQWIDNPKNLRTRVESQC